MARWTPRLIPKQTYQGRRRVQQRGSTGRISGVTETNFKVENASYHPMDGWTQNTLPSGYRDNEAYRMYTTTRCYPAQEGTDNLADKVDLIRQDGSVVTMDVIKVRDWHYNIQGHYEVFVAKENER